MALGTLASIGALGYTAGSALSKKNPRKKEKKYWDEMGETLEKDPESLGPSAAQKEGDLSRANQAAEATTTANQAGIIRAGMGGNVGQAKELARTQQGAGRQARADVSAEHIRARPLLENAVRQRWEASQRRATDMARQDNQFWLKKGLQGLDGGEKLGTLLGDVIPILEAGYS